MAEPFLNVRTRIHQIALHSMVAASTPLALLSLLEGCLIGYLPTYQFEGEADRQLSHATHPIVSLAPSRVENARNYPSMVFADEFCRFVWTIRDQGITLTVTNLSNGLLTIPVAGGSYVDESGGSHELFVTTRLYHGGPKDPQPIGPQQALVIDLYPKDYLRFQDNSHHHVWPTRGIFAEPAFAKTPEAVIRLGSAKLGRSIQFAIPLLFTDTRYQYRFRFKLAKVGAYTYRDYM